MCRCVPEPSPGSSNEQERVLFLLFKQIDVIILKAPTSFLEHPSI